MPKSLKIDKAEIFSLKYIIIMGIIASILALASWIVVTIELNLNLLQLKDAETYFASLAEVSVVSHLLSSQFLHFMLGLIFSGLMLLIVLFLMKDKSLIIFDYTFSRTQLGILLIVCAVCNLIVGVTGFWVGDILGIIAGVFAIIHDLYMEDWKFHRQLVV